LQALATQTEAPPFEVIVVENGSFDGTGLVATDFSHRSPFVLGVVSADQWQGASYARNVGIRHARSERVMFCDADDVVSQWWVAHGAKCFGCCDLWSGNAILLADDDFADDLAGIRRRFGDRPEWLPPRQREMLPYPVIMGGNFGATKEVLRSLGAFDQSFPVAGEDNDLAFRAYQAGVPIFDAPSLRIGFRGKWDLRSRTEVGRTSALAHALIASRYDAWSDSRLPTWHLELIRCLLASARMLIVPSRRDWIGLRIRWAIGLGLAEGVIRYRYLHRLPDPLMGLGWLEDEPKGGGGQ
jgi:glycosyltransferase involved in cell wall biosynthesis